MCTITCDLGIKKNRYVYEITENSRYYSKDLNKEKNTYPFNVYILLATFNINNNESCYNIVDHLGE